jgi:ribonuclease-3
MLKKRAYGELERRIGHRFRREERLVEALTHRSYRFESAGIQTDNERLEFLGDAVLTFLSAAHLYEQLHDQSEGVMTAQRSRMISGKTLASCARVLELGTFLRMGMGEERSGGRERASNLANALEAVVGAAYLDGGLRAALKVFQHAIVPNLEVVEKDTLTDNPKGQLQEYAQAQWKASPQYEILSAVGPAHATEFTVRVTLPDGQSESGLGRSKQMAESQAAINLLRRIEGAPPADGVGGPPPQSPEQADGV